MNKNFEEIIKIIKKAMNKDSILQENKLINDLGMASLDYMRLVVDLENHFNIRFEDDYLMVDNFVTVHDLSIYVEKLMAEQ